jgi:hypothetical protein
LRLKTLPIIPLTVVGVLVAGTTVVMANPGEHKSDKERQASASQRLNREHHQVRPPSTPPVTTTTTTPVTPPTTTTPPVGTTTTTPPVGTTTTTPPVGTTTTTPPVGTTTTPPVGSAQAPVGLGTAGSFAILSKSGITDVPSSIITGNVGTSPITGAGIGLTCAEVTGTIFSVNAAGPLPCRVTDATGLTAAVSDEETAYTDAAGRTNPDSVNLGAGQIGGLTMAPGLYKWTTNVGISSDVTLAGGPNDVWIFQIAGTLNQASATKVILSGGAQAKNVFWQTAGGVAIGTTAHSEGTIMSKTMIAMNTGASTNGRLLGQTAVTLQKNTVTIAQ